MSQENNVVLIEIKVSEEEVKQKIIANREALIRLKAEAKATKAEFDKGIITAKEYAKSQQAIETQVKAANVEIKKGEATLKSYAETEKKAEEALKKVGQSAKAIFPAFKVLTDAQGQHLIMTKAISERIQELSDQFKVEEAAIKANVSSIDKLGESIAELDDLYGSLSQAQREDINVGGKLLAQRAELIRQQEKHDRVIDNSRKTLKDYIGDIDILGFNIGHTVESFKSGAQGAGLFAKSIFTGRGALIALTAVPIIALLSGLYIILTKSQKGMDFLARATSGVSAVFSAVIDKVIAFGNVLSDAWDNPTQAVKDFGSAIVTNITNRFKAVAVIIDAIRQKDFGKIADGVIQLGTGAEGAATKLKKVYDQGAKMADLSIQIKEEEIKLNTERARGEKIIERQKQIAEDATKSTQKRATAARAAFAESQKIQNSEEALQKKRVQLAQAEAKQNQGNREYRLKVSEEQAKLDEIAKNRIGERTELQNQLNSIEAEGVAKALENAKKVAAERVAIAEEALVQAKKNGEDTVEIEAEILKRTITLIQAKADADKVGVEAGRGAAAQRKLIQANADAEMLEATKQNAIRVSEIIYNAKVNDLETSLAFAQRGSEEELKLRVKAIEAERNKQQKIAEATIKDKQKLLEENTRLVATADRAINDAREAYDKERANQSADLAEKRLQTELDLGNQSLAHEREVAGKRIDLEEKTQKAILGIEKFYGQISSEDYLARLNAVQAKALAAHKELNKQIALDDLDNQLVKSKTAQANAASGTKAELDERIKQINIQRDKDIKNAKQDKDTIALINATANKEIAESRKELTIAQIVEVTNEVDKALGVLSTLVDGQTTAQLNALEQQQDAILSSAALTADARAEIEKKFQKEKEAIEKTAAEKRRKIALAENLIATARGITESFKLPPPFSFINAALVAAQGIAQQVIIDNQRFAVGGVYRSDNQGAYVRGPGSGTRDSINAKISNGESIINAKSTAKYYSQLSAINEAGGGRPFPGVRPFAGRAFDTAHAVPKFAYGGVSRSLETEAITNAIIQGMQQVQIGVAVTDIRKVDKDMKYVEVGADHTYSKKD